MFHFGSVVMPHVRSVRNCFVVPADCCQRSRRRDGPRQPYLAIWGLAVALSSKDGSRCSVVIPACQARKLHCFALQGCGSRDGSSAAAVGPCRGPNGSAGSDRNNSLIVTRRRGWIEHTDPPASPRRSTPNPMVVAAARNKWVVVAECRRSRNRLRRL